MKTPLPMNMSVRVSVFAALCLATGDARAGAPPRRTAAFGRLPDDRAGSRELGRRLQNSIPRRGRHGRDADRRDRQG